MAALAAHESVALIFDEAQDLSDQTLEELRLLSNSPTDIHKRFKSCWWGSSSWRGGLNGPNCVNSTSASEPGRCCRYCVPAKSPSTWSIACGRKAAMSASC